LEADHVGVWPDPSRARPSLSLRAWSLRELRHN